MNAGLNSCLMIKKCVVVNPAGINADYVREILSIRLDDILTLSLNTLNMIYVPVL